MADDATKFAHEGGDTAPGTREQIAQRNREADAHAEVVAKAGQELRDAMERREGALAEADEKLHGADSDEPSRHDGSPVPPSREPDAIRRGREQAESAQKSSGRQQQSQKS